MEYENVKPSHSRKLPGFHCFVTRELDPDIYWDDE